MDSKTVKLNCLTLGELENLPIFKKSGVFLYSVVLWKVVLCFTGGERDMVLWHARRVFILG